MAPLLSSGTFLARLKAEGIRVAEQPGWRVHNRNHKGPWGPMNGVVIHHTAGTDSLNVCINGVAGLPGPLCHTHLAKNGLATMVGYGRTNHAGTFAQNAHDAVVAEASMHPRPDAAEPVDGNQRYYGIEIENMGNGRDPYPAAQYDAAVRWAAAICRAHGWTANSVIGHKEGTRRKIDPSFDMGRFRADVAERLTHAAGWSPGTTPPKEDDVPLTKADVNTIFTTDNVIAVPADWSPGNDHWTAASLLVDHGKRIRSLDAKVTALTATNGKLVDAVAQLAAGLGDLDPAAIVAELRAAIESIEIRLDVPDA
ncbi:peptidoglycan recognition protein family protein [Streptomyces lasiicapitis]|uniref:peptidoglycan recognition protein family protein n=1 Tax=Streptomyces lasiicapitis TaxID=1923961 RepID=UPI0036765573